MNVVVRETGPPCFAHFILPVCFIMKACKEKVKPQIGLAARKFGRRWGERSAAQISHHKVPA